MNSNSLKTQYMAITFAEDQGRHLSVWEGERDDSASEHVHAEDVQRGQRVAAPQPHVRLRLPPALLPRRHRHPVPVHRHSTTHSTLNTSATVTPVPVHHHATTHRTLNTSATVTPFPVHSHATTHSTLNTSATVIPFPCTTTLQHIEHSIHPLPSPRSRAPPRYNTQNTQYIRYRHPVPVHRPR